MGIMDDVVVNAKNIADAACKKASEAVDITKLRINAAELNSEITKKYEFLGRLVYDEIKDGSMIIDSDSIKTVSDDISALIDQLKATRDFIAKAKKMSVCTECGFENSKGSVFCNHCGSKLDS